MPSTPERRRRRYNGPRGNDLPICETCSKRHLTRHDTPSCAGHVRYDRDSYVPGQDRKPLPEPRPCEQNPIRGLKVCGSHGGSTTSARKCSAEAITQQKAEAIMRRFGEPVDTTPSEALLDTVKWNAGYVGWLRDKVAGLEEIVPDGETDEERIARDSKALTQLSKQTGKHEPSVWLDLLSTWQDKLVRSCEAAIRAGIEERRVRLAEQQGALVADVIRKILGELQLTPEQAATAGSAVPRHLRALAG